MKIYYRKYELLQDVPTGEKKGDVFTRVVYHGSGAIWYYSNKEGLKLKLEQMTDDFFKPLGEPKLLYPKFPSKKDITEYYHIIGEGRQVSEVDEIRAIDKVFYSVEYYNSCYELLKKMYNDKFYPKTEI